MDELREWKNSMVRTMVAQGCVLDEDAYVVQTEGMPRDPHAFAKGVKVALTTLGIAPVTFRDLRHTHATWLLESGVELKVVSQRLGHSSITVTADVYSHVTKKLQREAMGKLEEMMCSERGEK